MNREMTFWKMVAAGNDFVVVDNRETIIAKAPAVAREVCDRHQGIGADGLLLIENSKKGDYRMRIFNADGSEAEACGNGFRCVARFAHERLGFGRTQRFESLSGLITAEVRGEKVRVRLAEPSGWTDREEIEVRGRKLHYYFVNTGVPHTVIFVEGISEIPVETLGSEIRHHPQFRPHGTNVDFVEVTGPHSAALRTYERGVESETLACGTGAAASGLVSARIGLVRPPVEVKTRSGELLTVDFSEKENPPQKVTLEGEGRFVFEGKWKGSSDEI